VRTLRAASFLNHGAGHLDFVTVGILATPSRFYEWVTSQMAQRIDVNLNELHQIQRRLDRRQLEEKDWPVIDALFTGFVDRQQARFERLFNKTQNQSEENPNDEASSCEADIEPNTNAELAANPSATTGEDGPKPKPKGHGRNGAAAFTHAKHILHCLSAEVLNSLCAVCGVGRMTKYREKILIRVIGQPLFSAELHHAEQVRCRLCGCILTAILPVGVEEGIGKAVTYHWSACATLIVMHYFAAMPLKRLEMLHQSWGIPLADANQWEMIEGALTLLAPLLKALEKYAVENLTSFTIDDTGSLIVELRRQIEGECESVKAVGLCEKDVRTGINATCVVVETKEGRIILFYTGRHHAGEIVSVLMKRRPENADKVVKVTDGASKNFNHGQDDKLIEGVCNAHAFLKFHVIKEDFPADYAVIAEAYNKVFENDAYAATQEMSPAARLEYHKRNSEPWMKKIKRLCEQKIRERSVEPRSPLWEPVTFIINQWPKLTEFLKSPNVPIHTNIVEQNLIIPVRYLAASFSFKNQTGADAGDEAMTLIVTARACGVEPVAYLTHCLENHKDLKANPQKYLPWIYRERMKTCAGPPPPQVVS
jgi:transposase